MTARQPTEERKLQIADAALKVIAEQGLRRFTAAEVAKLVGLAPGTLFRHFADLPAIGSAAISRLEEQLFEGFPPRDEDPIERLGSFFLARAALMAHNPVIARLAVTDDLVNAAGEQGARRVAQMQARSLEFILGCLREASRQGKLRPGVAPEDFALIVQGAMQMLVLKSRGVAAPRSFQARARRLWTSLRVLLVP